MNDLTKPVSVAEGLWWVGSPDTYHNLQCNPFLYVDGDSAVLFDPGSTLDGKAVLEKVRSLIPLENLEAIVCSHQDPDLCTAISLFEEAGFNGVICCHERSALIIRYYGFRSSFYLVNRHTFAYTMKNGESFSFIFTPYLHFPGAIMSYLPKQQVLISGDVFGSITADWTLYADESYMDGMIAYHEAYMPSHEILASAMGMLEPYPISLICPQHGSIIKENIPSFINTLKHLPCGIYLKSEKQELPPDGIRNLLNKIITRLITIHGGEEVKALFRNSPYTVNIRKQEITKTSVGEETLWNEFFTYIEEQKGTSYLSSIASLTEVMSDQYNLPLPIPFSSLILSAERAMEESRMELFQTREKLKTLEESLYRDPITKLYNQHFYDAYLREKLQEVLTEEASLAILMLSIDNLDRINLDFGNAEGDKTMRNLAELLGQLVPENFMICRLSGGIFALMCTLLTKEEAITRGTELRNAIAEEERFINPITISVGLYHSEELPTYEEDAYDEMATLVTQSTLFRLRLARKQGGGEVISSSTSKAGSRSSFTILLVDNPGFDRDLIKQALEKERYRVLVADDGLKAKKAILKTPPDLIICELHIAKLSGLTLKKELQKKASSGRVPFILLSPNKNEQTIKRAFELQIRHYLPRPVALYELTGLVNLLIEKEV